MKWLKLFAIGCMFLCSLKVVAAQNYIAPSMVTIPSGQFIMGSDTGGGVKVFPHPVHAVKVKTFQLSPYEVTVKEFRKFVEETKHKTKADCWKRKAGTREIEWTSGSWDLPQYAPSELHPVMCIGMDDALAYMAWLSKKTGKKYRLPTEAEWEYAARAGSKDNYFFGSNEKELCQYANVLDRTGARAFERDIGLDWDGVDCDDHAEYTSIVGGYKPNAFGLFDMIGNVGELVEDCEHLDYHGAPVDGSAWLTNCYQQTFLFGFIKVSPRIIHRGGNYGGAGIRLFDRGHTGLNNASSLGEGFRIAQDVSDTPLSQESRATTEVFLKDLLLAQQKTKRPL